jgi:hypothetical protein
MVDAVQFGMVDSERCSTAAHKRKVGSSVDNG